MTPGEAQALGEKLLRDHGLDDWRFAFDRARSRLGACHFHRRTITLSRHLVALNGRAEIEETLLHEIAHALVGPGHGHGPAWQRMARRIGIPPRARADADVRLPIPRWALVCEHCHRTVARRHQRRLALARVACGHCGPVLGTLTWQDASRQRPDNNGP